MAAAVVIGSLKIWPHLENTRFEVIITLLRLMEAMATVAPGFVEESRKINAAGE